MAASSVPLLWWILFILRFFFTSADQIKITTKPEEDTILECKVPDQNSIIAVEWRRSDQEKEYVLSYRDDQLDPFNQHPSYKNRVALKHMPIKDGDLSLVLKNTTTNDTGIYECRVQYEGSIERKPVCTINLDVTLPGDEGGSTGLIVGLSLLVVLVVAAGVLFLIYKKHPACLKKKTSANPTADL